MSAPVELTELAGTAVLVLHPQLTEQLLLTVAEVVAQAEILRVRAAQVALAVVVQGDMVRQRRLVPVSNIPAVEVVATGTTLIPQVLAAPVLSLSVTQMSTQL
jgi:hypothetical protein